MHSIEAVGAMAGDFSGISAPRRSFYLLSTDMQSSPSGVHRAGRRAFSKDFCEPRHGGVFLTACEAVDLDNHDSVPRRFSTDHVQVERVHVNEGAALERE